MEIPAVEIDGITFRVISYNPEANNNKRRIVYESSAPGREPELYAAYRSSSEMGFWRLCLGYERLEKGADYVQASFIHLELQKYFNIIIQTKEIPMNSILSLRNAGKVRYNENSERVALPGCIYSKEGKEEKIKNHLRDYETRIVKIEELKPYLQAGCSSTKVHEELFKEFSDFIESSPLFDVESVELIYPNYTFSIHTSVENVTFQANIYCCNFTSNAKLYFMKYDLVLETNYGGGQPPFTVTGNFAPLIFTPKITTITEFGTYSQYIMGGLYICKIFDYKYPNQITRKEHKSMIGFGDYTYVGNRYTNLYPYKYMRLQEDGTLIFVRPPPSAGPLRIRAPPVVRALISQKVAEQTGEISPLHPFYKSRVEKARNFNYRQLLESLPPVGQFARNKAATAAAEAQRLEAQVAEAPPPSEKPVSDPWAGYSGGRRKKKTRRRKNQRRRTYRRS